MQIACDTGVDLFPPVREDYSAEVHIIPQNVIIANQAYACGVDIQPADLYARMTRQRLYPSTAVAAVGEFGRHYRQMAALDPEILSIHMSSGLSATLDVARSSAELVPEAHITYFDSKSVSIGMGWQVAAAVQGRRAGWPMARILQAVEQVRAATQVMLSVDDLGHLVHGGRIGHLAGLGGTLLDIKPILKVDPLKGNLVLLAKERTFRRTVEKIVAIISGQFAKGTPLRIQIGHAANPKGVEMLGNALARDLNVDFWPTAILSPQLGAHGGPTIVGLGVAAKADLPVI
jgi:DegV family protein with EDD domain